MRYLVIFAVTGAICLGIAVDCGSAHDPKDCEKVLQYVARFKAIAKNPNPTRFLGDAMELQKEWEPYLTDLHQRDEVLFDLVRGVRVYRQCIFLSIPDLCDIYRDYQAQLTKACGK